MVWWPFIVLGILAFLAFYPLALRFNFHYAEGEWQGKATLHPFFGLKYLKITIWDSEAPPKTKKPKKEKKKKDQGETRETTEEGEGTFKNLGKKILPKDIILTFTDIIKDAGKGIKKLRVRLDLTYALDDPAAMGYLTGAVYSAVAIVMGDQRKTRWRLGIYPNWQYFETMVGARGQLTLCIFDIFYCFGGILKKTIGTVVKLKGGNKHGTSH